LPGRPQSQRQPDPWPRTGRRVHNLKLKCSPQIFQPLEIRAPDKCFNKDILAAEICIKSTSVFYRNKGYRPAPLQQSNKLPATEASEEGWYVT